MKDPITFTLKQTGDVLQVDGPLNEFADFAAVRPLPEGGVLKLHLDGLTSINSAGLRVFILFLKDLGGKYEYWDCHADFIDQLNMIPSLLDRADATKGVRSLQLRCTCRECDHEQPVRLAPEELAQVAKSGEMVAKVCERCRQSLAPELLEICQFLLPPD